MLIPENILQQLKFHCEANGLGMHLIITEHFGYIVFSKGLTFEETSILVASSSLEGALSGEYKDIQDAVRQSQEEGKGVKH